MVGSPPQIETTGAPHSSMAAMHCSTVNISLIVDLYSRMRPQPVQVKLQACSGSSIITSGNLSSPRIRLPTRYLVSLAVSFRGNLIRSPGSHCAARAPRLNHQAAVLRRALQDVAVARQRIQREIDSVQVVFQIENAREARAGELLLVPGAVPILLLDQVRSGTPDALLGVLASGE